MLSIILPSYNEEPNVSAAAQVISQILEQRQISYEILFVDDGSGDQTFAAVKRLAAENPRIKGLKFSRNFGKEAAIMAGLKAAKGECCVVMDCDLQHPPEHLPAMYEQWRQGYLIVEGVKRCRGKEGWLHHKCAGFFNKIISYFLQVDFHRASDYKLLDRKVVDILLQLPEKNTFFRGLSLYFGFPRTTVEFEVSKRANGESKWSLFGLFRYAVNTITSFTAFPLYLIMMAGLLLLLFFFILGIQTLYNYLTANSVAGFTTVILLLLLIGSILFISLGIMGHYIAKIYEEVKGRPRYIIEQALPDGEENLEA